MNKVLWVTVLSLLVNTYTRAFALPSELPAGMASGTQEGFQGNPMLIFVLVLAGIGIAGAVIVSKLRK